MTEAAKSAPPKGAARGILRLYGDRYLLLRVTWSDSSLAASIPGGLWDQQAKGWVFPFSPAAVDLIQTALPLVRVEADVVMALADLGRPRWAEHKPTPAYPLALQGIDLYAHQIEAYNRALNLRNVTLFMEMRTGKTPTTIALAGARFYRGEAKRMLVVAPNRVVPEWAAQIERFADFPYRILPLAGMSIADREKLLARPSDPDALAVAIVNYEATWRMEAALLRWKPDIAVADESHKLKTASSLQSKVLHKVGKVARYKLALTGTPGAPEAYYSQYKFADRNVFGDSKAIFLARYCNLGGFNGKQVVSYKALDDFTARAHSISFRVRLRDVVDMPPEVQTNQYCDLEPGAAKVYRDLLKKGIADLEAIEASGERVTVTNVLTLKMRLQQVAGGHVKADERSEYVDVSKAKVNLLDDLLETLFEEDGSRKVVIFARFSPEIAKVEALANARGWGYEKLVGGTKDTRGTYTRFAMDPDKRLYIAQQQTAQAGIPLDCADTAIFYSLTFNPDDYEQAMARIRALHVKTPRQHIHLVARVDGKDSVDAEVIRAVQKKMKLGADMADGWRALFHEAKQPTLELPA